MIDPLLTARLDVLRRNLSRLADPLWLMRSMQLRYITVPEWLWTAFEATIGKEVKVYQPKLQEIESLLRKAGEERQPVLARRLTKEAWQIYTDVCRETHQIFEECLTFIGGLTFRNQGLDERICPIADELIRDCSRQSTGGPWESLTVPALREAGGKTLARIIRLRFQEWTIWTLPFTAHEFGHVVISDSRALKTFIEDESVRNEHSALEPLICRSHLNELLADAFATYTMGPAYACAAIMLRFNPLIARHEDDESPSDCKRAHVVLSILEQMNAKSPKVLGPYKGVIEYLKRTWEDALTQTESLALSAQDKSLLDSFSNRALIVFNSELISTAVYPPTVKGSLLATGGWSVAQSWDAIWREELAKTQPLTIPTVSATHKFRDVLNAAWLCRIGQPENAAAIAGVAQNLCDDIIEKRIKAEPAKRQFYQAFTPK